MKLSMLHMPVLILPLIVSAHAQRRLKPDSRGDTCSGPTFSAKEVSQRARITYRRVPEMTQEARADEVRGRVKLEAVLCRTGRVTDVGVIEGLPYGMTAKAVESVFTMRFKPAEMNWHTVSERMRFDFDFNGGGSDEIPIASCSGRSIDRIELIGYRRFHSAQILKWISTRAGDVCSSRQVQRDLEAILNTGYFDKRQTRVFAEEETQGRLGIVFETIELPLISEVRFEGLMRVSEEDVYAALLKEKIDLSKGAVAEPEKIQNARRIISEVLTLHGQRSANVEVRQEFITAFTVTVTFDVTGIN